MCTQLKYEINLLIRQYQLRIFAEKCVKKYSMRDRKKAGVFVSNCSPITHTYYMAIEQNQRIV